MKPTTSNFASCWGLLRPIIKSHSKEKWAWPYEELSKIFGFHFNIAETAEASDFKFDMLLEFGKAHQKRSCRKKVGVALDYGSSQNLRVFF